jgi:hypothetical protein
MTIKSLGSHLFSRSLEDEHKNEFTRWRSCCACDLVIGPCISIEGVVVSDVDVLITTDKHNSNEFKSSYSSIPMNLKIYSSVVCYRQIYAVTFVGDMSPTNISGWGPGRGSDTWAHIFVGNRRICGAPGRPVADA